MQNLPEALSFLVRPYDSTLTEDFSMYDKMGYTRDTSICTKDTIRMNTGNVIKYYHCSQADTPFIVDNMDDVITYKINQERAAMAMQNQPQYVAEPEEEFVALSPDNIDALLKDNDN